MLSRAVVLSRSPIKVYNKGFASSSKTLKGISIGGQSSRSTPSIRSSFAALKQEVERSTPPNLQDESKIGASSRVEIGSNQQQNKAPTQVHTRQPSRTTSDDPVRKPKSNNSIQVESSTNSQRKEREEAGRRNPFSLRNRLKERVDDGWGPGLRAKIEEAQKTEEGIKETNNDRQINASSNFKVMEQKEEKKSSVDGVELNIIRDREYKIKFETDEKLEAIPFFEEFKAVKGRYCTEKGWENWQMFTKQHESGTTINLLVRKVRMQKSDVPLALTNIGAALLKSKALPRSIVFRDYGKQGEKVTIIQMELGGYIKENEDTNMPAKFPFKNYPGIRQTDGKAAQMIDVIFKMEENLVRRYEEDKEAALASTLSPLSPPELSPPEIPPQDIRNNNKDGINVNRTNNSPERTHYSPERDERSRRRTSPRQDDVQRRTQSPDQDQYSYRGNQVKREAVESEPVLKDKVKASFSDQDGWTSMYSGLYGRNKAAGSSSGGGISVHGRVEKKGTRRLGWNSMLNKIPTESNAVETKRSNLHIEDSTPVYVDGKQAQDMVITSGSEYPIKMAQERQEGMVEDKGNLAERVNENNRIEDAAPVFIDGEQASEKSMARDTPSFDAVMRKQGSKKNDEILGEAVTFRPEPVEQSTPVFVDDQQASGTATAATSTSGAREAVQSANKERAQEDSAMNNETSTLKEENIDESTPVHMDSTQAKVTASTLGAEYSIDLARRQQADHKVNSIDEASNAVEEATPVYVDGEQATGTVAKSSTYEFDNSRLESQYSSKIDEILGSSITSSSEPIEDSTPVFVDEQQASGTATRNGEEKAVELANSRQADEATATNEQKSNKSTLNHFNSTQAAVPVSTSGAREAVKSANEGQIKKDKTSVGDSSNSVDESTPVQIDGTQAEDTTSTSGADHSIEVAQKRQEEEKIASSSSKPVDDSVPVAVEGEQVGKKE